MVRLSVEAAIKLTCGCLQGSGNRIADLGGAAGAVSSGGKIGRHRRTHPDRRIRQLEVIEQQGNGEDRRGRVGELLAGDVGRGSVDRLEHAREGSIRVDVAGGGQSDSAADSGSKIGDDVAEEVVRDDGVKPTRIVTMNIVTASMCR